MAGSSAPPTSTYSYLTARDTQGIALTCSAPKGEPVHGQSMAPNGLTTLHLKRAGVGSNQPCDCYLSVLPLHHRRVLYTTPCIVYFFGSILLFVVSKV